MATFVGTSGTDTFVGTAAQDDFYFDINNLTSSDTIYGGGASAADPIDRLIFYGTQQAGTVLDFGRWATSLYYPNITPNYIGGIEQIYLPTGGATIYLTNEFINRSNNGSLEIFCQGSGVNNIYWTLDASSSEGINFNRTATLIIHGGSGNDVISYGYKGGVNDIYYGGDGNDRISGYGYIYGDNGDDTLTGNGHLYGGAGNDTFYIRQGSLTQSGDGSGAFAYGGTGTDFFNITGSNVTVDGGDGFDFINVSYFDPTNTYTSIEGLQVYAIYCSFAQLSHWTYVIAQSEAFGASFSIYGGGTFDFSVYDTTLHHLNFFAVGSDNYTVSGLNGINLLVGNLGNDTLTGGNGSDTLDSGQGGLDTLNGGGGNDFLYGIQSTNFNGGAGDDQIAISGYGANVTKVAGHANGGDGNDTFFFVSNFINPYSGQYYSINDVRSLGYSYTGLIDISIDGGAGFDKLIWNANSVPIFHTTNVEMLELAYGYGLLFPIDTPVTVSVDALMSWQYLYFDGGFNRLVITGSGTFDLNGKLLSPVIPLYLTAAGTGAIILNGMSGDDTLFSAGHFNDILEGGAGNDILYSLVHPNDQTIVTLDGGSGNDTFYSNNASDVIYGGDGNDIIYANANDGKIDGGAGIDTIVVTSGLYPNPATFYPNSIANVEILRIDSSGNQLTTDLSLLNQFDKIISGNNYVYNNQIFLNLTGDGALDLTGKTDVLGMIISLSGQTHGVSITGTGNNDIIHGSNFGDYLAGGAGDDQIYGTYGNDTIFGGAGNDFIVTSTYYDAYPTLGGTSYVDGGDGNDLIYSYGKGDVVLGGSGDDTLFALSANVTYLYGGDGNDTMIAYGSGNYLDGGNGNDTMVAYGSGDYLDGGNGDDIIVADTIGSTYLLGGAGNDYLQGGDGNDYISGGAGNDTLSGFWGNDYLLGGTGINYFSMNEDVHAGDLDTIGDFTAGNDFIGLPTTLLGSAYVVNTAYGVDIYCAIGVAPYNILITDTHDVAAVTAAIYYYGL